MKEIRKLSAAAASFLIQPLQGCGVFGKAFSMDVQPLQGWDNLCPLSALEATTGISALGSRFSILDSRFSILKPQFLIRQHNTLVCFPWLTKNNSVFTEVEIVAVIE
jgi:hypothetical protein